MEGAGVFGVVAEGGKLFLVVGKVFNGSRVCSLRMKNLLAC